MGKPAKLLFFCGKMASGKSTLAKDLAKQENAVLLVQDDLLAALYPNGILNIADFVRCSSQLRNALAPHVCSLLHRGVSVVLDFPGNTISQGRVVPWTLRERDGRARTSLHRRV